MRARLILTALLLSAAAAAAPAYAAGTTVSAKDNMFAPTSTSVDVGQPVTWKNVGAAPHEVTAVDGSFTSGNIAPGASYSYTPRKAGRVEYYCRYHGTATSGMIGTLSVGAAGALPKTGGGREVATGVAVIALTMVVGGGLHVASRDGSAR